MKSLRSAKKTLPGGTLENYAAHVKAKVTSFEEEKKTTMGGLTEAELDEAERLMASQGEIADPNSRAMN